MKVLLLENISGVAASQFEEAGFEVQSLKGALEERELVEKVRGTSILGVRSKTRITAAVLDAVRTPAPDLLRTDRNHGFGCKPAGSRRRGAAAYRA